MGCLGLFYVCERVYEKACKLWKNRLFNKEEGERTWTDTENRDGLAKGLGVESSTAGVGVMKYIKPVGKLLGLFNKLIRIPIIC